MKKNIFLTAIILTVVFIFATACSVTPKHTHSYGEWQSLDGTYHSRSCSCGESEKEEHSFVNGKCSVCNYEKDNTSSEIPGGSQSGGNTSGGSQSETTPGQGGQGTTPGGENPGKDNPGQDKELPIDPGKIYGSDTPEFKQEMGKVEKALNEIKQNYNFKMEIYGLDSYCGNYEIGNNIIKFYDSMDLRFENPIYYYEENGQKYKISYEKRDKVLANYKEYYEGELEPLKDALENFSDAQFERIEDGRLIGINGEYEFDTILHDEVVAIAMEKNGEFLNDVSLYEPNTVENKLPEEVADLTFKPDYEKTQQDIRDYISSLIENQNFTLDSRDTWKSENYNGDTIFIDGTKIFVDRKIENGDQSKRYFEKEDNQYYVWEFNGKGYDEYEEYYPSVITFVDYALDLLSKIVIEKDSYNPVKKMYFAGDEDRRFKYWIRLNDDGTLDCERYYLAGQLESYIKIYNVGTTQVTLPERKATDENQDQTESMIFDIKQEVKENRRKFFA